jgi:hypothetical protein
MVRSGKVRGPEGGLGRGIELQRVPMKLMQNGAADSACSLSPLLGRGEGGGEGQTRRVGLRPSPQPSPR